MPDHLRRWMILCETDEHIVDPIMHELSSQGWHTCGHFADKVVRTMRTLMTICEAPALHEGRALPNPLYHATPSDRVASIMQHGLGGVQMKNFEVSRSNVVYLSDDPDAAESYAANAILMASDNPSRFPMGRMDGVHSSGITTFQIDSSKLDRSLFRADRNHEKAVYGGRSFEYHGIIPPDALFVYYTS